MKTHFIILGLNLIALMSIETYVQAAESEPSKPTSRGPFEALSDYDIAKIAESLSTAELEKWAETSKELNTILAPLLQKRKSAQFEDYWTQPGQLNSISMNMRNKQINTIAWSQDGRIMATGFDNTSIVLWGIEKNNIIYQKNLNGHTDAVTSVAFSPDKKMLVSGGLDGIIAVWDIATGTITKRLVGLNKQFNAALFSHDGKFLAYTSSVPGQGKAVKILTVKTNETLSKPLPAVDKIMQLAFLPDDDALAIFTETKTNNYEIITWNFKTGQEKKSEKIVKYSDGIVSAHPAQKEGPYAVAFSPDVKMCAMGYPLSVVIVDVKTGKKIAEIANGDTIYTIAFSPDGNFLAIGYVTTQAGYRPTPYVVIDDIKKETIITTLMPFGIKPTSVSFSPSGQDLALGFGDGSFNKWQMRR